MRYQPPEALGVRLEVSAAGGSLRGALLGRRCGGMPQDGMLRGPHQPPPLEQPSAIRHFPGRDWGQ